MGISNNEVLPLHNKTILVTRAASQSGDFCDRLHHQGATVIEMPTLEIVPPSSWTPLDEAIAQLSTFDWLILTSANGVHAFFDRLAQSPTGTADLNTVKIAVVGKKTARSLAEYQYRPDFTPPNFVADSLISTFPQPEALTTARILFPRVESGGRTVLVNEFTTKGATVVEVPAYQSQCPQSVDPKTITALENHQIDVVTFASSKTVRFFAQLVNAALSEKSLAEDKAPLPIPSLQGCLKPVCIASIGPQTTKTCQELLGRVDVEAEEYTLDGLMKTVIHWSQKSAS